MATVIFYPNGFPSGPSPILVSPNGTTFAKGNKTFRIQFQSQDDSSSPPADEFLDIDGTLYSGTKVLYLGYDDTYWQFRTIFDTSVLTTGPHTWRARVDWDGETNYSSTYSFTLTGLPEKPVNPTPMHTGTDIDFSNKTLSWTDGGGADTYDIYVGDAADNLTLLSSAQVGTSLILTDVQRALFTATGYWRVDATNISGTTTGDVWNFTCAAPGKAQNPTPIDTAEDVEIVGDDKLKLLQWEAPS